MKKMTTKTKNKQAPVRSMAGKVKEGTKKGKAAGMAAPSMPRK